jgi:hypothetical protein
MGSNLAQAPAPFRNLEGRRVRVSLANGAQLDVEVISAGRGRITSLWLDLDGADLFVEKAEVLDIQELLVSPAAPHQDGVVHSAVDCSF